MTCRGEPKARTTYAARTFNGNRFSPAGFIDAGTTICAKRIAVLICRNNPKSSPHHLSAAVCTGASQSAVRLSSSIVRVIEHPAMSSEVT